VGDECGKRLALLVTVRPPNGNLAGFAMGDEVGAIATLPESDNLLYKLCDLGSTDF
jgi:hypothetical protein